MNAARYRCAVSARDSRALGADIDTSDLEVVRRRRGPGMRDSAEAELWAKTQTWYSRVVRRRNTGAWWVWKLVPERRGDG